VLAGQLNGAEVVADPQVAKDFVVPCQGTEVLLPVATVGPTEARPNAVRHEGQGTRQRAQDAVKAVGCALRAPEGLGRDLAVINLVQQRLEPSQSSPVRWQHQTDTGHQKPWKLATSKK
jgi:hypothetical protein